MVLLRLSLVAASLFIATSSARSVSKRHVSKRQGTTCPADFLNVVFNTAAYTEPNWPGRFDFIQSYGISNWISFFPHAVSPADSATTAGQIREMVHVEDVQTVIDQVTPGGSDNSSLPAYTGTFNEPDGGFYGLPLIDPQTAYNALLPLLNLDTPTQLLSPAVAYPVPAAGSQSWLQQFMGICGDLCMQKFAAISIHIYNTDAQAAISMIDAAAAQFPGKDIWISELAPAPESGGTGGSPGSACSLSQSQVIDWMNTVLTHVTQPGSPVKRVFWNCGEWAGVDSCDPSLTTEAGAATPLLEAYGAFCGHGGSTAPSSTNSSSAALPSLVPSPTNSSDIAVPSLVTNVSTSRVRRDSVLILE
ncbi:MAG: hypothetical protein M1828_002355 [Chrysothrix sp. TS-e1954]|nr:MAG: hypothetical protein M1828_002355 [Chrysothrix sp. TS-e1954]